MEFRPWDSQAQEIAGAINDFFRIPLSGEYSVEYSIDKTIPKQSTVGVQMYVDYSLNAGGVVTEDACYFTFNTVTDSGAVVDTSLIPEGYGIYRLPYEGSKLDFDAMKMVYALDPAERYDSMTLSGDGERLRLLTWQGEDLMLTVIDIASMTQLQKVKLLTASEDWYDDVIPYDDFLLILQDRYHSGQDTVTVWAEQPDGRMTHALTADVGYEVFPEGEKLFLFSRYENAVDYRDGKLMVAKHRLIKQDDRYLNADYCDLYVVVYDTSGMVYAGICHWNLTDVNALYYNNRRIGHTTAGALDISW